MAGSTQAQLILRADLSRNDYLQHWVWRRHGSPFEDVLLFCCGLAAQDPFLYQVWVIPVDLALLGGTAYVFYGSLPQALRDFYGADVGERTNLVGLLDYPEYFLPRRSILGKAYILANEEGHLDYYYQHFKLCTFDSVIFYRFRIEQALPEQWYLGTRVYIGPCEMPQWQRPLCPRHMRRRRL